jgi:penicillin-binding protein 1B
MAERKRKKTGSRARSFRRALVKVLIGLGLVLAIALGAFLIRYYYIFDGTIEQKLGNRRTIAATRIYSAPTLLRPGKALSLPELRARLRRLGYEEGNTAPGSAGFRVTGPERLLVRNDASSPVDPGRAAEIRTRGPRIEAVLHPDSLTPLESFGLRPELLSNVIDERREKRREVAYDEIPQVLVDAVLASEDRRFFSHGGIDPIRILKALIVDIRAGEAAQGASTLTQQFVKNYFLTPERTLRRKFADAYMSVLLERRLTKRQIFELYSNEVYLGQVGTFSIVGFGEAANAFFHKNIRELSLEEAATLAGIISAPNRYGPLRYPQRALERRNLVLDLMAGYGMISPGQRDEAKARPVAVQPTTLLDYSGAPYFVDYVQERLLGRYGADALAHSKFRVYTTLDTDLQQAAFEAVEGEMGALDEILAKRAEPVPPGTVQASLIAVDPKNGHVLAMIGGRDYGASQFNRITESKRQPGSIFKPLVYAAALETAYSRADPLTAATLLLDRPTRFQYEDTSYEPHNYNQEYLGQVSMRQALTRSLNVPTMKLAETVGFGRVRELALRLGLNEEIQPFPSIALGSFEITPLEMVRAYTAFAGGGLLSPLTPITAVIGEGGAPGPEEKEETVQALTPEVAFMVTSLLQSVIDRGTGAGARARGFSLPAAGKTGTSHDGWFAGYTPDLLCIVWVGFDDNRELKLSGSQAALPIWTEFMKKAADLRPLGGGTFEPPEGVVQVEIDPTTGLLATERCLQRLQEYYIQGTEPTLLSYGNNYAQADDGGAPVSIYATPRGQAAPR